MTDYKCEEVSLCENFQAAICLHCKHRLCVRHITEHDKIVFDDAKNLSNLVEVIFQQIKDKSEKSRIACNDLSPLLGEWHVEQLEKIEEIYQNELRLIGFQQEALEDFHRELLEQLERDAQQPLERIQRQQNASTEILDHIRHAIETVRNDAVNLRWDFSALPSVNTEYSLSDFPPRPAPVKIPITDGIKLKEKQSTINEKSSPGPSTDNTVKMRTGHFLKRVVTMFENISSIEQSKNDISIYIKNQGHHFKLPVYVGAYLKAWHGKLHTSEKAFLLNEHISTIRKYLVKRSSDFDVLIGIQAFFFQVNIQGNKIHMMNFLLQFFLKHRCISQKLIIDWYNDDDAHGYMGYPEAKQLVKPFIQSLATIGIDDNDNDNNHAQAAST